MWVEGKALMDMVLPRHCVVCDAVLMLHEKHICATCLSEMPLTYFWQYEHNSMADNFNAAMERLIPTDGAAVPYMRSAALFYYSRQTGYRKIPQLLKYMGKTGQGEYFAGMLGKHLASSPLFKDVDAVVPVPLHWSRKLSRGYNQAEVIARAVARELGVPVLPSVLKRVKRTTTQTRLTVEQKADNVRGAFRAGKLPQGISSILLVDDVFTTGSTLASAAHSLKSTFYALNLSIATIGYVDVQ